MRIDEMTLDQLLELNDVICQRIDELKEQETLQALSQRKRSFQDALPSQRA
jgi:hypothetical protein